MNGLEAIHPEIKSLSGSEGMLDLSKFAQARVEKSSQAFPLHHKAWLRTVKRKNQNKKKVLKTSKRRSVFKQGRKTVKSSKGGPKYKGNRLIKLRMKRGESTASNKVLIGQEEVTDMPKVIPPEQNLVLDKVEEVLQSQTREKYFFASSNNSNTLSSNL
ncbi:hypothetical protein Tco_0024489 [Tanacetum coccineum]